MPRECSRIPAMACKEFFFWYKARFGNRPTKCDLPDVFKYNRVYVYFIGAFFGWLATADAWDSFSLLSIKRTSVKRAARRARSIALTNKKEKNAKKVRFPLILSAVFFQIFDAQKKSEIAAPRIFTRETTISDNLARQNSGGHYTRTKIPCKP